MSLRIRVNFNQCQAFSVWISNPLTICHSLALNNLVLMSSWYRVQLLLSVVIYKILRSAHVFPLLTLVKFSWNQIRTKNRLLHILLHFRASGHKTVEIKLVHNPLYSYWYRFLMATLYLWLYSRLWNSE